MSTANELKQLAEALEQSKGLADKNKEADRLLVEKQRQIEIAQNEFLLLQREVESYKDKVAKGKIEHDRILKARQDELIEIDGKKAAANEELQALLVSIATEKEELAKSHKDLDKKIEKNTQLKADADLAIREARKAEEESKRAQESAEASRAHASSEIKALDKLSKEISIATSDIQNQKESLKAWETRLGEEQQSVNNQKAENQRFLDDVVARETRVKGEEARLDAKRIVDAENQKVLVELLQEIKTKGVDADKVLKKYEPEVVETPKEVVEEPVGGKRKSKKGK